MSEETIDIESVLDGLPCATEEMEKSSQRELVGVNPDDPFEENLSQTKKVTKKWSEKAQTCSEDKLIKKYKKVIYNLKETKRRIDKTTGVLGKKVKIIGKPSTRTTTSSQNKEAHQEQKTDLSVRSYYERMFKIYESCAKTMEQAAQKRNITLPKGL